MQTGVHSALTRSKPLMLNCWKPCTFLIQPLGGSPTTASRFDDDSVAKPARSIWHVEQFKFSCWFASCPVLDEIGPSGGETGVCASFRGLHLETPSRGRIPFRWGPCSSSGPPPARDLGSPGSTIGTAQRACCSDSG